MNAANRRWLVASLGQSIRGPRVMIVDLTYASGNRFLTGLAPTSSGASLYVALKAGSNAGVTGAELRETPRSSVSQKRS